MKKLILMRHAKSDWSNIGLNDFDRPLNNKGKKDALNAGKLLNKSKFIPDFIISSPAKRAILTAKIIAKVIKLEKNSLICDNSLYEGDSENFIKVIKNINQKYNFAMIIAHNPGIYESVIKLVSPIKNSKKSQSYDSNGFFFSISVPTASMSFLEIKCKYWSNVSFGENRLLNHITPKIFS